MKKLFKILYVLFGIGYTWYCTHGKRHIISDITEIIRLKREKWGLDYMECTEYDTYVGVTGAFALTVLLWPLGMIYRIVQRIYYHFKH